MATLKISALNIDTQSKDRERNLINIERALENSVSDVILLPEMFTTGFYMDTGAIAEQNMETLLWMKNFAKKKNAAVCGSISVKENSLFFNRCYFVKPSGEFVSYDKRHLFSYSGEQNIYTAGNTRKIVEYNGSRFLLQICYDLRFPVFSRNNNDYDIALYLANWPKQRIEAWNTLLKARAIENQAYIFGVNRIGTDKNGLHYPESTQCFFADGQLVSQRDGSIISAEVSLEKLFEFRKRFCFLADRDSFELNL
ncbi:amidohydrolase [Riemerella columbipharyngis]|uniref:Predicted amidohydrolase n=1 Tax=Riemerella columbipharyngis TaxID=1071918 RepID=A0A1G7CYK6_9FLAO|nr:amidohydrolase [Riemerella columbipharyngis]SDE43565.1 Predicted amidohydrolase [Riemerella columbipharyngis]